MKKLLILSIFVAITLVAPRASFGHPGRTASDGCHYCRTNCDSWGEDWNVRHCHNGGGTGYVAPISKPLIPSCPVNSTYSNLLGQCSCDYGYASTLKNLSCVKIPLNAQAASTYTDAWKCNEGYTENTGYCIKNPEITTSKNSVTQKNIIQEESENESNSDVIDTMTLLGLMTVVGFGAYGFSIGKK